MPRRFQFHLASNRENAARFCRWPTEKLFLHAFLVQLDGPEKVKQVFRQRRRSMEAGYRGRTKGKEFEQRVSAVAAVLTECGYMAEVEFVNPDEFLLTLGNCAIRDVAKRFPEACDEELCLVRNLVNAKVTRVSHLLAGNRHCSYRICAKARRKGAPAGQTASDEDAV